ncbi:MAG: DUF1385 domain-containing protein [Desulfovibrionaceae bacterium]|nr:DUF1385 domain-containing protein [Desulfovibrionaceae bacterium]
MSDRIRSIRFVRGFPILVETLINGIKTLNRSAELQGEDDGEPMEGWHLALTLVASLFFAILLSVVIPHGLTWLLNVAGVSGDVSGVSFQIWDGLFKLLILVGYILLIRRVPEIRRVFQYHGAEHKTIHAFETGRPVDVDLAAAQSRLHPRCGTTFLLFVVFMSVLLHAVLVPLFLHLWQPEGTFVKHAGTLVFKLALIAPVASISYELIRSTARMRDCVCTRLLRAPGLMLQKLTTMEPEREHLEVALVALKEALGPGSPYEVKTVPYERT